MIIEVELLTLPWCVLQQIDRKKKPIINQLFRHEDGPRIGRGDRPTVAPERGPGQLRGVSDPLLQHQRPETPSNV